MQYTVNWSYRAGKFGPWQAGDLIDLADADAEHVNADSPGVLSIVLPKPVPVPWVDADEPRPVDRMARTPGRKRAGA